MYVVVVLGFNSEIHWFCLYVLINKILVVIELKRDIWEIKMLWKYFFCLLKFFQGEIYKKPANWIVY